MLNIYGKYSSAYLVLSFYYDNRKFYHLIRELEEGGGDRKFSKTVELLGPQNLKMVELLEPKFAKKGPFVKNFVASSAQRPISSFRSQCGELP